MSKERPTVGTDGNPLPVLPPERDARVYARLARIMVYTPGFLALLLVKAGEPTAFGLSVEMLMLASASAVVGGLFVGSQSEGSRADSASRVGVWSGALVMELLCAVPILSAVPTLFNELATSALLHSRVDHVAVPLGVSVILPALAIVPFLVYQLSGFGTLNYVLSRSAVWLVNIVVGVLIIAAFVSNRMGEFIVERALGSALMLGMVALVWYGIVHLRGMEADYQRRRPHKHDGDTDKT